MSLFEDIIGSRQRAFKYLSRYLKPDPSGCGRDLRDARVRRFGVCAQISEPSGSVDRHSFRAGQTAKAFGQSRSEHRLRCADTHLTLG